MEGYGTGKKIHSLIDKVYHPMNLEMAWGAVKANGGSGGIDKVTISKFDMVAEVERKKLHQQLKKGTYKPLHS
jgi:RNA-directed DNA polymerase